MSARSVNEKSPTRANWNRREAPKAPVESRRHRDPAFPSYCPWLSSGSRLDPHLGSAQGWPVLFGKRVLARTSLDSGCVPAANTAALLEENRQLIAYFTTINQGSKDGL